MDRSDVGVIEASKGKSFFAEARAGTIVGERSGGKHLQSNVAVELQVVGAKDHTHPTRPDLLKHAVMPEHLSDAWGEGNHRPPS
jgi:hypothetical protein